MNKLCGTLFIRNGEQYDYCYLEAIQCLLDFCDYVIVVDAGSDDGTLQKLNEIDSPILKIISLPKSDWDNQHGKEKLNYFTNIAIQEADRLGFEYQINLQGDEIIHEKSYNAIREAVQDGNEGYFNKRINLWGSPYMQLNVTHDRLPCSSEIVRLTKSRHRSVGDAESVAVNFPNTDYLNRIRIYHMGFVRKREIMKAKVINMQENVFQIDHDKKLDGADIFIPERWFSGEDLRPIDEPLPEIIKNWAKERVYE